jgi:molybdenum-dependent DNA-binding transcriptional regulator ModE
MLFAEAVASLDVSPPIDSCAVMNNTASLAPTVTKELMEDLERMAIFARVVEAKSFSAAARQLGLSKSLVSKHVTQLEKSIARGS